MNFYIGNSVNDIDMQDVNAEFSDELIDYIYKLSKKNIFDMSKLYEIDPYHDTEIPKRDLPQIIYICKYILNMSLIEGYKERDKGKEMLYDLLEIAQKALKKDLGLVSIGD